MQKITLKKIDETNFLSAFGLKLREGQERFVSHPVRSLAQAYVYYHQCTPFGIFCDEQMVGYVMVIYDYDLAEYDIWHMMIDKGPAGTGIWDGRAAALSGIHREEALREFRQGRADLPPGKRRGARALSEIRLCGGWQCG